jgi:serine/threonine protein kinase
LKPGNILVNAAGEPKLLDFGIAKLRELEEGGSADVTAPGRQHLTPNCASPEQARGESVTAASDVYALGALLFEMLTGRSPHPFTTSHPSREEVVRVICEQEPERPSVAATDPEMRRELRGDLDQIVLHALHKEPARRYASAAAFAEDVRRHLSGLRVQAPRVTSFKRAERSIVQVSVHSSGIPLRQPPSFSRLPWRPHYGSAPRTSAAPPRLIERRGCRGVAREKHRGAAIRKPQWRSGERVFCGRRAGRNSDRPGEGGGPEGAQPRERGAVFQREDARPS